MPTDTLELLHKGGDLLKHGLFFGQVLRIQRAHLGQHSVQFCTAVTGKLTFQGVGDVAFSCISIELFLVDELLHFSLLLGLGKLEE